MSFDPHDLMESLRQMMQEMLAQYKAEVSEHFDRALSSLQTPVTLLASAAQQDPPASPAQKEKYHSLFLSHIHEDRPFVQRLRNDLMAHGVKVWVDDAEIQIGDSFIDKITEGMRRSRYIGVVLSIKSITSNWVKSELAVAINQEITQGQVVVLPLLYEKCEIPPFLQPKLYADFTALDKYEQALAKLLQRLEIK